jgi:hypothetical protein
LQAAETRQETIHSFIQHMPAVDSSSYPQLSPREVVKEMSFEQYPPRTKRQSQPQPAKAQHKEATNPFSGQYQNGNGGNEQHFQPRSPAPAAAPPPPPPTSESDAGSVRSVTLDGDGGDDDSDDPVLRANNNNTSADRSLYQPSYQTSGSRAAKVPMISNYGVSPVPNGREQSDRSMMRGDPSMQPNTGETNDEFGGIGSLREVTGTLRWMTITSTILAMIWEGFAFPTRLLVQAWIYPAKVVLGAYLGVFCLLLLGVELNAPLRDNFGVLYHPIGRGAMLMLMSGMCFGILAAWWEVLLGLAFMISGGGYWYAYIKYPEYRRWQDYNDNQIWKHIRESVNRRSIAWARPSSSDLSKSWDRAQHESQSLLHSV